MQNMTTLGVAIDTAIGQALHKAIFGDPAAKAAAEAAAAEAEREQQAALARQQALEAAQRQAMFDRLSRELKMSAFGEMQLKGFDNSADQMQLKGFGDSASNTGNGDLPLKGFGDSSSGGASSAAPNTPATLGPQTCFFGECGPSDGGLIEPWNDPKVVDLRGLQQGVDLAAVAIKAPPADRQTIMNQALAAANGDQSIQVTIPADTTVPAMSEQGLLAFQQANNAYRQAHDSAYQLQQAYNQMEVQRQGLYTVIQAGEQQLEADFRNHIDAMTLAEKEAAMAKLFDATVQRDLAYGKTWQEYLAARQEFYEERYQLQMYLWNAALGKQGNPPSPSAGLRQAVGENPGTPVAGPPDSDLSLLLPDAGTVNPPTKEDERFLKQIELDSFGSVRDPLTQRVIDNLKQDVAANWSKQAALACPPNILNQAERNPQLQQQMQAESKTLYTAQQTANHAALQDAENEWNQKIAQLQSQGVIQPSVPLEQQLHNNPQLRAQLNSIQKQVTSDLDYKVTRAQFEAEKNWRQWIEDQEAKLPAPTLKAVGAVRD